MGCMLSLFVSSFINYISSGVFLHFTGKQFLLRVSVTPQTISLKHKLQ